jgi:16S rRNA (uracil1498-N3)-methyltransferase
MSRRCYSETPIDGPRATLTGGEAHHLLHVLRATPGTAVTLFDGSGREFEAEVAKCGRSSVDLVILSEHAVSRELPFELTLAVALPKGDRQRWLIEKAMELGVTRLVPLVTERSIATAEKHAGEKLGRYVIEASKQCGRNRLMQIAEPLAWHEWLQSANDDTAASSPSARRWIAHPGGRILAAADLAQPISTAIAIGPEGGLTEAEIDAATAAGWDLIGLGPRILRIETAAISLAALAATLPVPSP